MLYNNTDEFKEVVVVPDGRIDLFVTTTPGEPFSVKLLGLGTLPSQVKIAPRCLIFSISFNPLAAEYILERKVASIVNSAATLTQDFWNLAKPDLNSFDAFCLQVTHQLIHKLPLSIDPRKGKLFNFIFSSHGAISVAELSDRIGWSSRQINRYFNDYYGLSLKTYCSIIRFRASLHHLKEGKLFPEENFSDQPHFIREVKKLAGASPKELARNQNDRFIQFFALPQI